MPSGEKTTTNCQGTACWRPWTGKSFGAIFLFLPRCNLFCLFSQVSWILSSGLPNEFYPICSKLQHNNNESLDALYKKNKDKLFITFKTIWIHILQKRHKYCPNVSIFSNKFISNVKFFILFFWCHLVWWNLKKHNLLTLKKLILS